MLLLKKKKAPQDLQNNVFQTDKTKVESVHNAQHHVVRKLNIAYQHTHLIKTVQHSGGG